MSTFSSAFFPICLSLSMLHTGYQHITTNLDAAQAGRIRFFHFVTILRMAEAVSAAADFSVPLAAANA
jgi:hypothetical protein